MEILRSFIYQHEEIGILLPRDADDLFDLIKSSRRHLARFLPWVDAVESVDDERDFIREAVLGLGEGSAYHFGIWVRRQLCGVVSLEVDQLNNSGELGYYLGERFIGRGTATRAGEAVVAFAFANLGLNRVEANVSAHNVTSAMVCQRLGMAMESTARRAILLQGTYYDRQTFRLLASDYLKS